MRRADPCRGPQAGRDRWKASGRKSICRECDREKARRYYAEHREEKLAKLREKRRVGKPQPLSRREERELVLSRGWREG